MTRPKEVIDSEVIREAKDALEQISDHQLCFRFQAIINCGKQGNIF